MGAAIFSTQASGGLWSQCTACGTVIDCCSAEWLHCDDDSGEFGGRRRERGRSGSCGGSASGASEPSAKARSGRRRHPNGRKGSCPSAEVVAQRLENLTKDLFSIHDLNRNGLLEEEELVTLNERIAVLHHGKGFDTSEVRATYRSLFREKLDPDGQPVEYKVFRAYALEVLNALDEDPEAQEMILEQFVAEAQSGAALLDTPSMFGEESVDESIDGGLGGSPDSDQADHVSVLSGTGGTTGTSSSPLKSHHMAPCPHSSWEGAALQTCSSSASQSLVVAAATSAGEQQELVSLTVPHCSSDSSMDGSAQGCTSPCPKGCKTHPKLFIDDIEQRSVRRSLPGALLPQPREASLGGPLPQPLAACRASAGPQPTAAEEPATSLVC